MLKKTGGYFLKLLTKVKLSTITRLFSEVASGFKKFRITNETLELLASVCLALASIVILFIVIYIGGLLC